MTLSEQFCSITLAKRLKELGVKQESLFFFRLYKGETVIRLELFSNRLRLITDESYSAFTVAELGKMLGKRMLETYRNAGAVLLSCYGLPQFTETTEANARAKMLIYLLENKLITL